jgi:hypothetical protein
MMLYNDANAMILPTPDPENSTSFLSEHPVNSAARKSKKPKIEDVVIHILQLNSVESDSLCYGVKS